MTVAAGQRVSGPFECTGGETILDYDFKVLSSADLAVWRERGGGEQRLVIGIDYTVDGIGNASGGSVTLAVPALEDDKYILEGDRPASRVTDIVYTRAIPARALNSENDALQVQISELRREMERSLKRSRFDSSGGDNAVPDGVVGYLYMDADGNLTVVASAPGGGGGVSLPVTVEQGGTGGVTPGEARSNLGLGALATKTMVGVVDIASGVVRYDVIRRDLATPPVSPSDGQQWIVAAGAAGAWAGKSGQVARWVAAQTAYAFFVPVDGWQAYDAATSQWLGYTTAGGWTVMFSGSVVSSSSSSLDGRVAGRFGGNGQGLAAGGGWWTYDNRIFLSGASTNFGNADPAAGHNYFAIQVPWDKSIGIKKVTSGTYSHFLIDANDNVWSWGGNSQGQLGHGDTTNRWQPTRIAALNGIAIEEVIPERIGSAALYSTLFREKGGTKRVWGCGNGSNNIFGNGATSQQNSPIQIGTLTTVEEVAFCDANAPAFFRLTNGKVYVTGGPSGVANGLGTGATASTPTEITALANEGIVKMRVASSAAGAGSVYYSLAGFVTSDGRAFVCGNSPSGLGLGATTTVATFTQISALAGGELFSDLRVLTSTSGGLLAFITSLKNLWICGYGATGVWGDGTTSNKTSLFKPTGTFQGSVDRVSLAGADASYTIALEAAGVLWTCGYEANGNTAQGDYNRAASARVWAKVQGLDGTLVDWGWSGGLSGAHGLRVVLSDGRAKAAGYNGNGETGTQPGNVHVVSTLQDVKGLPDLVRPGARWYLQHGAPSSSVGNDNDLYLDLDTGQIYGPKASGAWGGASGTLKGADGVSLNWRSSWATGTAYAAQDGVASDGSGKVQSYVCKQPHTSGASTKPGSGASWATYWDLGAQAGNDGTPGAAATIAVHTVTTGAPGSPATVTNVGTSAAASLDFVIPAGLDGASAIYVQSAEPVGGNNGDLWIDSDDGKLWKKITGTWTDTGYIVKGPPGPAGSLDFSTLTHVTPATGDKLPIGDVSDSDNVRYVLISELPVSTPQQTALDGKLDKSGGAMTGSLTLSGDATAALHPVSKQQFDNAVAGLKPKGAARCRTTANVSISGGGIANGTTHDGVTVATGEIIAVMSQSALAENGLYVVPASGAATRAANMDSWSEVVGAQFVVSEGTLYADTGWLVTADQGGTLGTTAINFAEWFGTGIFQAASAILAALAGVSGAADKVPYFTGASAMSVATFTAAARTLVALSSAAAMFDSLSVAEADVASASTCDIGAAATSKVRITGTTTITGLGTVAAGTTRWVRFAGALTLTHNGTSLILPTAANIVTAAGDAMLALSLGSGNWLVYSFTRADGSVLNSNYLRADVTKNLSVGYTTTEYDNGNQSGSGTLTPNPALGQLQKATNHGAFTLAPPSASGAYSIVLDIINDASAGTITVSGSWTKVTGDAFDTTNAHAWKCYITKGSAGTHLHKQAMF